MRLPFVSRQILRAAAALLPNVRLVARRPGVKDDSAPGRRSGPATLCRRIVDDQSQRGTLARSASTHRSPQSLGHELSHTGEIENELRE